MDITPGLATERQRAVVHWSVASIFCSTSVLTSAAWIYTFLHPDDLYEGTNLTYSFFLSFFLVCWLAWFFSGVLLLLVVFNDGWRPDPRTQFVCMVTGGVAVFPNLAGFLFF